MNLKKLSAFALALTMLLMTACGDDSGSSSRKGIVVGESTAASGKAPSADGAAEQTSSAGEEEISTDNALALDLAELGGFLPDIYGLTIDEAEKVLANNLPIDVSSREEQVTDGSETVKTYRYKLKGGVTAIGINGLTYYDIVTSGSVQFKSEDKDRTFAFGMVARADSLKSIDREVDNDTFSASIDASYAKMDSEAVGSLRYGDKIDEHDIMFSKEMERPKT